MKYHNITKDDMLNGDGLRVVLWVSGCEHHCKGCQNPITWDPNDGLDFDVKAMTEIVNELEKDYISGLTFSGGDPLHKDNRLMIFILACFIKYWFPWKTIWLYTGYKWEDIYDLGGLEYIDVVVEGPYVESLRDITLKWRGSSNQRVIDVKKSLETGTAIRYCD